MSDEGTSEQASPAVSTRERLLQQADRLLEFPRVREMLADHTRFFRSRELAAAIAPSSHCEDVRRLQDETAEAVKMLDEAGDIGLTGHEDPRPILRRAALGGTLAGRELVDLVNLFESIRLARNVVLSMKGRAPLMEAIASDIPDLSDARDLVLAALAETGDVKDSATPRLGRLRRNAARAYQRLVRILERLTVKPDIRAALQSPNIATRGDRLVLEVRTDSRDAVPGIVHDVSNTGATFFVEPFQSVEPCNSWREQAAEAQREEERVLRNLSKIIGDREGLAVAAIEAAADIDLITARARLAKSLRCARPETLERGAEPAIRLVGARHPLLGESAVPISIWIGPGFRGVVITGPNTGGKTVAIKTIGLLALMHQCGLHLPAESGTSLATFTGVYADIGDAQSIDRSVSTFSSHMGQVVDILREAGPESLVLLDELGTGTDPEEGSALARAVLSRLVDDNVPVAVTTHHRAVAEFASAHPRISNASVELDAATLRPSYRFVMGVPGRSYALHVARNLGLGEALLAQAESFLGPERASAESLLMQIQGERDQLAAARDQAEKDTIAAEAARHDLETRLAQVTRQQDDMVQRTRMTLRREADDVRRQLRRIVSQAESGSDLATAQKAVNRLRATLAQPTWLPVSEVAGRAPEGQPSDHEDRPLKVGDDVEIKGLDVRARVVSISDDGAVDLQMGNAHIQMSAEQLRLVEPLSPDLEDKKSPIQVRKSTTVPPSNEIDVRGHRVNEIAGLVGQFLDQCTVAGSERCRIIHGAGTGALRQAVRDFLSTAQQAGSFSPAPARQGGNGATVVELI